MPCPKDFSRIDSTGRVKAGSQKQIQIYVNEKRQAFNSVVAQSLPEYGLDENAIHWVSPLPEDTYSEYQDSEFLERVGLGIHTKQLQEFWPRRGPCWDALARIEDGCVLIEAKSHVPEIYSGGCGASSKSRQKIKAALDATKTWLEVSPDTDWTGRLYQSANRYSCLYFLRQIAKAKAFLVNVYFVGDPRTPTSRESWDAEIESVNRELGLVREVPYSAAVFLKAE